MKWLLILSLFVTPPPPSEKELKALSYSLDPHSISKHFAFYNLYPQTEEGKKAKAKAWQLLTKHHPNPPPSPFDLNLPDLDFDRIIQLVNRAPYQTKVDLSEKSLQTIEALSSFLGNRQLKGYKALKQDQILKLQSEEVDLARALFLFEEHSPSDINTFEAQIDLMALQILAHLNQEATPLEKVRAISHFIFFEQGFRFPPHSLYAEEIDLYTFLPSVLDSRQGVCLGVSILYLALAQRLDLDLAIITPPGHIFLRLEEEKLNIETTARGINPKDETYLGVNTRILQRRPIKEVVGLAFINQAAALWQKERYEETLPLYQKAALFLEEDPLLTLLLGYNYILLGKEDEGTTLLKKIAGKPFKDATTAETLPLDYLEKHIDKEGIQIIFSPVDDTIQSIEAKQKNLQSLLKKWPRFQEGWFHLAITYLQLSRLPEAYLALQSYHLLNDKNPTVEYYLTHLALKRYDFPTAFHHFKRCEHLLNEQDHHPKMIEALKQEIHRLYPN
ncbi:MAG: transglutaminase family protein [Simkaniaceae bacterium]